VRFRWPWSRRDLDDGLPPDGLRRMVGSVTAENFRLVGEEFAGHLTRFVGLQPTDRVLDLGSGSGRLAIPLLERIGPTGSYDGIDVHGEAIAWCQQHLTPEHPNFRFHHADVRNAFYNPEGRHAPTEQRLPFDEDSFDVVVLASVFTHLLPDAVANHLGEISRVLAPGGRLMTTYFLLDEHSRATVEAGAAAIPFRPATGDAWVVDPTVAEAAVAIDGDLVRRMHDEAGLPIRELHPGSWARSTGVTFQDLVVAAPTGG
jgi:SAM-dependent methyltransferase